MNVNKNKYKFTLCLICTHANSALFFQKMWSKQHYSIVTTEKYGYNVGDLVNYFKITVDRDVTTTSSRKSR